MLCWVKLKTKRENIITLYFNIYFFHSEIKHLSQSKPIWRAIEFKPFLHCWSLKLRLFSHRLHFLTESNWKFLPYKFHFHNSFIISFPNKNMGSIFILTNTYLPFLMCYLLRETKEEKKNALKLFAVWRGKLSRKPLATICTTPNAGLQVKSWNGKREVMLDFLQVGG